MATASSPITLGDDFNKRAKSKLETASAGKFFQSNSAKLMPSFGRGATAADGGKETNDDEVALGVKLGEGAFCDVYEISAIVLKSKSNINEENGHINSDDNANEKEQTKSSDDKPSNGETDEADFPVIFQNKSEVRKYMSENCIRNDAIEGDQARYALKKLKAADSQKQLEQGLIDVSIEAQFLACLNHPNVSKFFADSCLLIVFVIFSYRTTLYAVLRMYQVKIRGVAGDPLTQNFGLVLDRLYMTLEDKMDYWTDERKAASGGGLCRCLFGSDDSDEKEKIIFSAMTVAYDLACALRYIHSNNLVYRDIKPENAGFDVRGDIKLFDFGFCKELTKRLFDKPSGMYKLTRMTGSPPYMAPENFLGKPYGKAVDVFSFGVLLWEMLHSKFAFYQYNKQDYKDVVIERNYRPSIDKSLSSRMQQLIKESWHQDPKKRPTFDRISLSLRAEYQELSMEDDVITRSQNQMHASMRSFKARNKK